MSNIAPSIACFFDEFPIGGFFPVSHITKRVIVVDTDINVHDLADVEWALWSRVADARKYMIIPDVQSWELERCAKPGRGSLRLGIDATMDMEDRESLKRPLIPGAANVQLRDYVSAVKPPLTSLKITGRRLRPYQHFSPSPLPS